LPGKKKERGGKKGGGKGVLVSASTCFSSGVGVEAEELHRRRILALKKKERWEKKVGGKGVLVSG
jgi:hypothetical protein